MFVAFCIVPTIAVLGWAAGRYWPGHAAAEARRLSHAVGLRASLEKVAYPRPGTVLYYGLQITDPETDALLLRCRALEVRSTSVTIPQAGRRTVLLMVASQPEVEAEGLPRLGELLRRVLAREPGPTDCDLRLSATELTLRHGADAETLRKVRAGIETFATGTQAQIVFRLAGNELAEPARLRLVRNRQTTPPALGVELDTAGAPLPSRLLAMVFPQFRALGQRSGFCGHLWAVQERAGWSGELSGQFGEVDLGLLVSDHFPHRLAGTAEITVQLVRFHNNRLEEATALLTGGPGTLSRSLWQAAVERLRLVPGELPTTAGDLISYDQLAVAVALDSQGLILQGRCGNTQPGTLLTWGQRPILGEPLVQPRPVAALIQALVPHSEQLVPATRETDWLTRYLPVPRAVSAAGSPATAGHSRLRPVQ
jgi:hypothetical protein